MLAGCGKILTAVLNLTGHTIADPSSSQVQGHSTPNIPAQPPQVPVPPPVVDTDAPGGEQAVSPTVNPTQPIASSSRRRLPLPRSAMKTGAPIPSSKPSTHPSDRRLTVQSHIVVPKPKERDGTDVPMTKTGPPRKRQSRSEAEPVVSALNVPFMKTGPPRKRRSEVVDGAVSDPSVPTKFGPPRKLRKRDHSEVPEKSSHDTPVTKTGPPRRSKSVPQSSKIKSATRDKSLLERAFPISHPSKRRVSLSKIGPPKQLKAKVPLTNPIPDKPTVPGMKFGPPRRKPKVRPEEHEMKQD